MTEKVERRALSDQQRPGPTVGAGDAITGSEIVAVPFESLEVHGLVDGSEGGSRGLDTTKAAGGAGDDRSLCLELRGNHGLAGQVTGLAQVLLQRPPDEIIEQPAWGGW